MPLDLLFRWNHLNSFSISVSSYTSFSNHLFKGCDRPWWVSFANKIVKALLKHNHHKLYISGRVMELSSGYNCSVLAWSNFVNQTCFFELINQVTNLTTQVKLLFGFNPENCELIFQYSNYSQTCIKQLVVKVPKFVPHNYTNFLLS